MAFSDNVMAKCAAKIIHVTGKVIGKDKDCNDYPISDAAISIFFNDDKRGESVVSKADGTFELKYIFYTYNGTSKNSRAYDENGRPVEIGEDCSRRPSEIILIVHSPGCYPAKMEFEIEQLDNNLNDDSAKVNFIKTPPVELEKRWNNN